MERLGGVLERLGAVLGHLEGLKILQVRSNTLTPRFGGGYAGAPPKNSLGLFLVFLMYILGTYVLRNRKVKKDMRRKGR